MAISGRKPKPVERRRREGNPGHRPIPEPVLVAGRPEPGELAEPPAHLPEYAQEFWRDAVVRLAEVGIHEKELRDRALLGALHPGLFDDDVEVTGSPRFDAGARIDPNAPSMTPAVARAANALDGLFGPFPSDELGWVEYEIEDGADLFFRQLGER